MTTVYACRRCGELPLPGDAFCRRCGTRLLAPPGWYDDPQGRGGWRWWDGAGWTDRTHDVPEPPVAADTPDEDAATGTARPAGLPGLGVAAAGFVLGAGLAVAVTAAVDAAGRPGGDAVAFVLSELALWLGLVGATVVVSRRRGTGSLARDFGWRITTADLGIGALGAMVGRAATVVVAIPLYGAFHDLLRDPHISLPVSGLDPAMFAAYAATACLGAPIVEELFFRGLVQTRLVGRWGAVPGITVTSVLFGAAHLLGWQGPASLLAAAAIAAGGAVLGYLRHRTGRLGTSTVAHALFNGVAVLLLGLGVTR